MGEKYHASEHVLRWHGRNSILSQSVMKNCASLSFFPWKIHLLLPAHPERMHETHLGSCFLRVIKLKISRFNGTAEPEMWNVQTHIQPTGGRATHTVGLAYTECVCEMRGESTWVCSEHTPNMQNSRKHANEHPASRDALATSAALNIPPSRDFQVCDFRAFSQKIFMLT